MQEVSQEDGSPPTRILLIDDSPEDRFVFRRLLTRGAAGRYKLLESGNAEDGLTIARKEPLDCVIVDYALPDRSGLEVLHPLREELDIPVVMMTGTGSEEIAVEAMKRGAHDYLVKTATTAAALRIAIENAIEKHNLHRQLAEQQQRERRIAETLQRSLLFKPAPHFFPGVNFELFYQPAMDEAKIGGDFYDVFAMDSTRVVFVVGDVSGKGLTAASWTAKARYGLRAFLFEHPHPVQALQRLNTFLCQDRSVDRPEFDDSPLAVRCKFVCLSLMVLDTLTGEALFTGAGAEQPLLLSANQTAAPSGGNDAEAAEQYAPERRAWSTIETEPALPLGIEPELSYALVQRTLRSGDIVVMTTDGVSEARRPGTRQFLGAEGTIALLRQSIQDGDNRLSTIGGAVIEGARSFSGGSFRDDVCLLLARLEPRKTR